MSVLDLKTILLARSETLAEIEAVTAKLRAKVSHLEGLARLEGWFPDDASSGVAKAVDSMDEKPLLDADYIVEAKLWLDELTETTCTTTEFVEWLERKYPDRKPNRNNVGSPFRHLKSIGRIVEEVPGAGRRPAIFRVVRDNREPEDDDDGLGLD